ncbi:MAG: hypothetical protein ACREOH_20250 [Candidatus Entotheonellia bacterium]
MKNGVLLQAASGRFDAFLTVDRNIPFQQNVRGLKIGILAIIAPTNRLVDLRPLMKQVRQALPKVRAGQVLRVGG